MYIADRTDEVRNAPYSTRNLRHFERNGLPDAELVVTCWWSGRIDDTRIIRREIMSLNCAVGRTFFIERGCNQYNELLAFNYHQHDALTFVFGLLQLLTTGVMK